MCGLKAAQMHKRPFRAAREPMQPSAAQDSFLPYGKKDLILDGLLSMLRANPFPHTTSARHG